jgi:hypothetical protein
MAQQVAAAQEIMDVLGQLNPAQLGFLRQFVQHRIVCG